jgi:TBC1 domain family protein 5
MTTSTHNSAFPLTDERSPEERPPWEPRSRLEMEREIADLRATNKKLGKSVGWIVDVLLQDESESKDPQELNSIKIRKREALESLSYIRDILIGNANKVDDELLVGEEELKARRSRESARRSEPFRAEVSRPATVPVHESRPKPASSSHVFSYTREVTKPTKSSSPSRTAPTSSPFSPTGRALTPPNLPANPIQQTRFAPWNYTRSNFSTGVALPSTSLPRLPPPTSANFHPSNATARAAPKPSRKSVDLYQAPTRAAQHDPLGVLQ